MLEALWIAPAVAATSTWLVIAAMARTSWASRLADEPNERSLHVAPTPRIGGLGIAAGIGAGCAVSGFGGVQASLLLLALALLGISLADDLRSLPALMRLAAHLAAAVAAAIL